MADNTFIRAIFIFPFTIRYGRVGTTLTDARWCASVFILLRTIDQIFQMPTKLTTTPKLLTKEVYISAVKAKQF